MLATSYDCPPTLTDAQVIDFCVNGYLILEGVVGDEVNRRTCAYLADNYEAEPTAILREPWFVAGVIKNPRAAGAVRSLLGKDFKLPVIMSSHRGECPSPAVSGWHRDGGSIATRALDYLQVFYYPQDTPRELGPTEVVPCSHHLRQRTPTMQHYGRIATAVSTAAPAGSIVITVYSIWHRRSAASATGTRHLLKYNYWRTAAPTRDWVVDEAFDFATARFDAGADHRARAVRCDRMFEQFRDRIAAAEMFTWLCGLADDYRFRGGQCWPVVPTVLPGDQQEGTPAALYPRAAAPQ